MVDEPNTMRKFLGWVLSLALVAATGVLIYEASQSTEPTVEEIHAAIGSGMPSPETADPPEFTEKIEIRGWRVWVGNYPKYFPVKVNPIDRRRVIRRTWSGTFAPSGGREPAAPRSATSG